MPFELSTNTECELTTFVGRTQKSGPDDVPAVTFRLKLSRVSNALLDLFSKTIRHTVYKAVEGQENLPGVEDVTPLLQSKDLVHWAPDTCLEGWTVFLARGISDGSALQMGSCKIDSFRFDFFEGGHMDVDFRVSTADVDEDGAGMLWGRQKRKVFVTIIAPELPVKTEGPSIDGTTGHPGLADSAAAQAEREAGDLFSEQHAGDFGLPGDEGPALAEEAAGPEDEGAADSEGGETDIGADVDAFEAGLRRELDAAGMAPRGRRSGLRVVGVE